VREKKLYTAHHNNFIKKIIFGGWAFRILGGVEYVSGQKNYAIALERHVTLLKRKGSLVIFPEGTRTKTGEIQTARGGVGYLVHATRVPIVPVVIYGSYKTTMKDILKRKRMVVEFLDPIAPEVLFQGLESDEQGFKTAAERVLEKIKELNPYHA